MTPTVEIVDPLTQPVPEQWSRFVREHALIAAWDPAALTAVARASTRRLELALVRDGRDVVALLCMRYGGIATRRGTYATTAPRIGIVDCSLPLTFSPGVAFASGASIADRRAAVDAFLRAIGRERGAFAAAVFRQIGSEQLPALGSCRRLLRRTAPVSVLENRWSTVDHYFQSLPRDRRRRFRRLLDEVNADATLDTLEAADAVDGTQASRLDQLTRLKHVRRGGMVAPIPVGYFDALSAAPGALYFGHRDARSNALLSFDLVFDDDAALVTTVTGAITPKGVGAKRPLYFDQYLREIAYAIERGLQRLEWGKGMLELKARFGSVSVPQYAVGLHGWAAGR
ncbi:MAG: hypothetical protein LC798_00935 [Chloroflexi bacterium]|nr:hypothetical protein [Chloroflexota bacterium]